MLLYRLFFSKANFFTSYFFCMVHYHGVAGFGKDELIKFLIGRHVLTSYAYPDHIAACAEVASTFILDNGAFSLWDSGGTLDVPGFIEWCYEWHKHPGYEWAVIPDIIGGSEQANDELIKSWPKDIEGAPVWHFYESLDKLDWLTSTYRTVCLAPNGGPNNVYSKFGTKIWWERVDAAMSVACDNKGRPKCKLHGLRILDPQLFTKIPLASADSSNAVQNRNTKERFGMYLPLRESQRAIVIAQRVEHHNSASSWHLKSQPELTLFG